MLSKIIYTKKPWRKHKLNVYGEESVSKTLMSFSIWELSKFQLVLNHIFQYMAVFELTTRPVVPDG